MKKALRPLLILLLLAGHQWAFAQIDRGQLLADLKTLSSDEYGGRQTGENELARTYLLDALSEFISSYPTMVDTFGFLNRLRKQYTGHNITVTVPGTKYPDRYIVLSAHYDHVGTRDGVVYNGADDNASGTCALLALARHYRNNPPKHSIIFAFFDAEEMGLKGADRFVEDPPVDRDKILLNINMDMVSRNPDRTINICGQYDFPELAKFLKKAKKKTDLTVTQMHEGPEYTGANNWTMSSDHGMFLKRGIPYLYFGVEDHPGYHQPSDDFSEINPDFYYEVVQFVKETTNVFDKKLRGKSLR
ncbi:M20/M25/M40 family metallo-hydrolase [Lewinella sp. W8]|uniref:M20/M25/M40 family metallo-hydrolase n=1 Tax=Lewinella sp. W8 TaxID=2528208 RepID=UPI0015654703|nr:M20/M25/M40 family metallo-hydrolase [Lewinella sp. W8]